MVLPSHAANKSDELTSLQQSVAGSAVALFILDETRGVLVPKRAVGPTADRLHGLSLDVGFHVSGWVAANQVPMVNADAQLDLDDRADEWRYALSMPLVGDQRLVGVLTMYTVDPITDATLHRVESVIPDIAASLAPSRTRTASALTRLRLAFKR